MFPNLLSSPFPPPYSELRQKAWGREKDKSKAPPPEEIRTPRSDKAERAERADRPDRPDSDRRARCDVDRDEERHDDESDTTEDSRSDRSDRDRRRRTHRGRSRSVSSYRDRAPARGNGYHRDQSPHSRSPSRSPSPGPRTPRSRTHLPTPNRTPSPPRSSRWSPRSSRFSMPPTPVSMDSAAGQGTLTFHQASASNSLSSTSKPHSASSNFSRFSPLTRLFLSWVYAYIVPHLPADLQALARDPPDLSRPETLVVLFRAIAPYTQFLLILAVLYVVWAVVTGFIGYMSRFMRFCFRIGPVVAVVAWIMAASGQGGIDVLFEALKQYAGLADPGAQPPRRAPGWQTPGTPGTPGAGSYRSHRRKGSRGSDSDSSAYWDPRSKAGSSSRKTREQAAQPDPMLASIIEDGLGATVQGYVKQAIARAAGLEWLVGTPEPPKDKRRERDERSRYSR